MADLTAIDGAIAALEAQRNLLGDAVVDTALAPLLAQRSELHERAMVEQRRLVTILFSDVVDFTVLSQQLDAEDVRTVMDAYFLRWHEHIAANGGVVEKFIGDAVMAVFGLRAADEEDPCRAIRAALGMRASLDEVNAEVGAAHGITLAMRVGIDTGDVVVSTLGERPGQDFVVVGEVVNRASRIQGAAPPGGVLVSADTFRHVRGAFDVQPVNGLRLKGIDQPVDAYLIQGERVQGFRADAARGVEGVVTRTIGRELELRQLQEHFQEVGEERRWQVVTVVGDAGVGKTRLLSEFARWLDELPQPVWWFGGRAAPSRASLPYALLHDLFAARLGINDSDGPSEVRRKWERGVAQALGSSPDAVDKAHVIGYWLGFQIGESASLTGVSEDPQSLSGRAANHLAEYFRSLAEQAPVVLLLEDIHWADEATLALMHAAGTVLGDCQMLVVASTRPTLLEHHPHWGEGLDFHTRLPLRSLSRRETRRLLDEILKRADRVPPAMSDIVIAASEGNPFYVEELVNWFIEAGVITTVGDDWHVVDERLEEAHVPATLRSVLQARLDALSEAERVALQRASVVGRVFWDDAVDCLGSGDSMPAAEIATAAALDQLRTREIVFERERSTFEHNREFLFKHALLRDVAYDGMLRPHRRSYHRLVARWFEQMAERSQRLDEYAGVIADHYANSGDRREAARWYLVAAQQAAAVHGLADARRLLDAGIGLLPDSADPLRFDLVLARETVLDRIGDRAAQRADLDALERLETSVADDPVRRVRLLLTRCRWSFHQSEYAAQGVIALAAIDLARSHHLDDLEAEARLWLGKGLTWEGKHQEARDALEAVLAFARARGQRKIASETLRYLAIVAGNVSEFAHAKALLDECIAIRREDGDEEGTATALVQMATVLYNEGHFADAQERLEQALPILVASGFRYREAVVVSNLASIVIQRGELGKGLRLIERGLELCIELEDLEGIATAHNIRGEIARRVGNYARAEEMLRTALATTAERGFPFLTSDSLLGLALICSIQGRHDEALANADKAITGGREADSPMATARALVGRGYVQLARGETDAASESLNEAVEAAERLELVHLVVEAEALLARVAMARGDRSEATRLAGRVFAALDRPELDGALQQGEIFRMCRDVFAAYGDPRAADVAAAGRAYVERSAALIDDGDLRDSFLRNVAANVELAAST